MIQEVDNILSILTQAKSTLSKYGCAVKAGWTACTFWNLGCWGGLFGLF